MVILSDVVLVCTLGASKNVVAVSKSLIAAYSICFMKLHGFHIYNSYNAMNTMFMSLKSKYAHY